MVKPRIISNNIKIPKDVEITLKSRVITVKGPRGTLTKSFTHIGVDMFLEEATEEDPKLLKVELWFGSAKGLSSIRTVLSHVNNMMTGVTKGFRYTMRFVYAHFPINATIPDDGKSLEIRNFLGEKRVRYITMLEDTKINRSDDVKDQLVLQGNDIEAISRTCALIHQSVLVKKKDIRMFLDGIYVESRNILGEA
mmetsp:Transcript_5160/g.8959  ORF Transcript_5160/g.8959 Transcript_5160/m.8959 type:complete len:195 (-) Transcript_5160:241-825(-)|eukprot:CAMPEP_0198199014 /NCGR_PEP_ID=MMETSP1445-20131203/2355_1 /TAXON_ID=36898 /ORGANISM="Pyramimonas sp., Strain CCMP2087" /LENGTH=194 /DNA_ID=CAMNT_0043868715 /DNA_START=81 /DNA_END=665 /DNA_ORIENTATION=-